MSDTDDYSSDSEVPYDNETFTVSGGPSTVPEIDRRAHHNALERKRRDHIKDKLNALKDLIPSLKDKKASRSDVLTKTLSFMQNTVSSINADTESIENLKRVNAVLEERIKKLKETNKFKSRLSDVNMRSTPATVAINRKEAEFAYSVCKLDDRTTGQMLELLLGGEQISKRYCRDEDRLEIFPLPSTKRTRYPKL